MHIDVISPLDGSDLDRIESFDSAAVNSAVGLARRAFAQWGKTPVKERVQPLFRFKHLVEQNIEELSQRVSAENGKTRSEAEAGIRKGLEVVEFATSFPVLQQGGLLEVSQGVDCCTRRYPLGVVCGITPFNFPAMVPLWMFPLAIAAGNAFLLKPSEQTPLTPLRFVELLVEAGLPEGVFQVVQGGRETAELLLDHPGIDAAAFVGSTKVAKAVYERGIAAGKRILALGGAKNHLIVVPDADLQLTAQDVVSSVTGCAGQRCMAASVLVAVGDCAPILDAIQAEMSQVIPGKNMGAIISAAAKERIVGYIDRAAAAGATIRVDGRNAQVEGKPGGYYVGPSMIDGMEAGHECACDEIFGPVLTVLHVDTLDAAIEVENSSPYGNAASIYTSSGATARYFQERANSGMIGINIGVPVPREPFSFGGWNESRFGMGDITGHDGLAFWTKMKKITTKWSAVASKNWMS